MAVKKVDPEALAREQAAVDAKPASSSARPELRAIMEIDGVEGFGMVDRDHAVVYVRSERARSLVPPRVDGIEIRCEVTGSVSTLGR
jgi:hypothetical protein